LYQTTPPGVNRDDALTTANQAVPEHIIEPHPGRTAAGPRSGPDRGNQGADAPPEHLARRVAQHAARLRVHRDDHRVAPVTRIVGRPDDDHRVTHRVEDAAHVVTRDGRLLEVARHSVEGHRDLTDLVTPRLSKAIAEIAPAEP